MFVLTGRIPVCWDGCHRPISMKISKFIRWYESLTYCLSDLPDTDELDNCY